MTKLSEYKGSPILCLNAESKYPFQFGVAKARLILEHLDAIRAFVDANTPKPGTTPQPEARKQ